EEKTVRENVELGMIEVKSMLDAFDEISMKFGEDMSDDEMNNLLTKQAELQDKIEAANGWELDRTLERAADALRLPDWDQKVSVLSGGEKRRVALCKLLLSAPDMLLLDEPTNHLDAETVAWLERFLADFTGTIVAVTHDRYFLDNVAQWILELDRGHGIPYEGNYSSWLEQKEQRLIQEKRQEASHMKVIQHELEWVRSNAKGKRTKSKARLQRFEELQSKEFQSRNETNQIFIPQGPRLGENVIEFKNVSKAFDDKYLIDDLSFKVPQGAIVGIIGPNGAGKSTLFNMVDGSENPDSGTVNIGETVDLAYVKQSRDDLNNDKQLWQDVGDGDEVLKIGNYTIPARAWLSR
ncbi:Energy-dependent translational throttle protein EttA, partial [hydrothermal vent metagenome]